MIDTINFETDKPFFNNGTCKWYVSKYFQNYLDNEQEFNLPKLKDLGCFIVKGGLIEDLVLIDNSQTVIRAYKFNSYGYEQMQAFINILKISKYYDECERAEQGVK